MRRNPIVSAVLALALAVPAVLAAEPAEVKEKDKSQKEPKLVAVRVVKDGKPEVKVIPFDGKPVPRGYLGVSLTDLTPELRTHFGVAEDSGVMVSQVEAGSPAEKAGIRVGDIITSFDGQPIESSFELRLKVREAEDAAQVPIEVYRDGRAQNLAATLEKRERPEMDLAPFFRHRNGERLMVLGDGEHAVPFEVPVDGLLKQIEATPGVRVERFHVREAELEKQLKELEKRIQELERQLEKR